MTINLGLNNYAIIRWHALLLHIFNFTFDFGWFSGNEFNLLQITIFELHEDYPTGYTGVTIFSVHFLKFIVSLGYWKS